MPRPRLSPASPLERIPRICAIMRVVILVGILVEAGGAIALWTSDHLLRATLLPGLGLTLDQVTLSLGARVVGFLVSLPPVVVMLAFLIEARALFGDYRKGRVFAPDVVRRLRRLAIDMIALACLQPFVRTLLVLALTFGNPPGHRLLSVGVSSNDFMLAAFGGLLLAVAWVMVEAARLADENRAFV